MPHFPAKISRWKPVSNPDPTAAIGNVSVTSSESLLTMDSELSSEARVKEPVEFSFESKSLRVGQVYKVNVHAVVLVPGSNVMIESKELHQKLEVKSDSELAVFVPNDNASLISGYSAQ